MSRVGKVMLIAVLVIGACSDANVGSTATTETAVYTPSTSLEPPPSLVVSLPPPSTGSVATTPPVVPTTVNEPVPLPSVRVGAGGVAYTERGEDLETSGPSRGG